MNCRRHGGGWAKQRLLLSTDPTLSAVEVVEAYANRWTIEMCQSWRVISLMGVHGKTSAAATALA